MSNVFKKLQDARVRLQKTELSKSGRNKFAGYEYFELGDFIPAVQKICNDVGLCGVINYTQITATLSIHDTDGEGVIVFESPMSTAALKGCHEVQNLGAVQSYLRRYLWMTAFEIVEHDGLDATTGGEAPVQKKVEVKAAPKVEAAPKADAADVPTPRKYVFVGEFSPALFVDKMLEWSKEATSTGGLSSLWKANLQTIGLLDKQDAASHNELVEKFREIKNKLKEVK
jgi:hypothetical protein